MHSRRLQLSGSSIPLFHTLSVFVFGTVETDDEMIDAPYCTSGNILAFKVNTLKVHNGSSIYIKNWLA